MKIQLIRNATLWLEYGGLNILVDPMLMDAESMPAFQIHQMNCVIPESIFRKPKRIISSQIC